VHAFPILPKTKPIRVFSEAKRISIASVSVAPIPTAAPFIAAITGFLQLKMATRHWRNWGRE